MSQEEPDRVQIFRDPALAWLVDRMVRRLERGKSVAGKVTKSGATEAERRAIDDLLGRPSRPGDSLSVDLGVLDEDFDLREIVQAIRGPITNRRAEQAAEMEAWNRLSEKWSDRVAAHRAWAGEWLRKVISLGVLKRLAGNDLERADDLLDQAWQILSKIHFESIHLASLAADITGDSHALDRGQPLSTLCLRGIAERTGVDGNSSAATRREAWATIGVTIDDLSAPVLCLNLRVTPDCDLFPWIDWHVRQGEPFFLPWRQIHRFHPDPAMERVYVCENPAVISEAATRLGETCRPLVCLNGAPSVAVRQVVRSLIECGIPVSVRADFDWAGLGFLRQMEACGPIDFWRMTVEDYDACSPSQPLRGRVDHPDRLRTLARRMESVGLAAYEEELIDPFLTDLSPKAWVGSPTD